MESNVIETAPGQPEVVASPTLSVLQRMIAVFVRPGQAWTGLGTRAQWWFPMIVLALVNVSFTAVLWNRAIVPMQLAAMEEKVASGSMPAERADQAETMMRGPAGLALGTVPWLVISPLINLVIAGLIMFSTAFLLGGKLPFRSALEVATWSGFVQVPGQILVAVLAWAKESMQDVHIGLAALLPASDSPGAIIRAVTVILDGLGPFSIWWLVIVIIGASTLSNLPRKRVAWSIGGTYLGILVFFAALAFITKRGG